MRILKFNEQVENMSSERIDEITEELTLMSEYINEKKEFFDQVLNELDQFKSENSNKIDQIDETIKNMQLINSTFDDLSDKLDNCMVELKSYKDEGRQYLY